MVKLTLLPLLASAAIASLTAAADPNGPPGNTDPVLSPPGMTVPLQPASCNDPDPARRPLNCGAHFSGTFRGGFGHYFGTSSGGGGS
jgi:hypothetical protein